MANSIVKQDLWTDAFIENFYGVNVGMHFVDDSSSIVDGYGNVKILSVGAIAASDYTPGTDLTLSDATVSANTLALSNKKAWAIQVDDFEVVQTNPATIPGLIREGSQGVSKAVDTSIFAAHTAADSANKITGTSGAALDLGTADLYEKIVDAGTALDLQGAAEMDRWIVLTPKAFGRLRKHDDFIHASDMGDAVLTLARLGTTASATPGYRGMVGGFQVFVSNNLPVSGGNAYLVFGQGKAINFASQLGAVEIDRNPLQFGTIVKQLLVYGVAILAANTKRVGSIYVVNS
jgi:hypothetical protein